ncbi:MAG: hypothetical protein KA536_21240 [Saprospiraceae bacterium]|jgi:hypothetical protein|nr:hypothetical protein [Saprospiraceae bacterium]
MIIFGTRASNIGNFDVPKSKCEYCEMESTQRISVFGKYAHIFWIPFFPIGKKAIAECTHCKRTVEQKEFSTKLNQLYQENKSKAKRPFWHWLGLGTIGSLIALITIIAITAEEDPRSKLLDNDLNRMTSSPTMESDSISFKIKQLFDSIVADEINPDDFEYLTKIQGSKALILVKMPKLKKVEKSERSEALDIIEIITNNQDDLKGKEKYIGVSGAISMMLIKTPTYEKNSKLALTSELFEFYGPKAEFLK